MAMHNAEDQARRRASPASDCYALCFHRAIHPHSANQSFDAEFLYDGSGIGVYPNLGFVCRGIVNNDGVRLR